MKTSSPTPRSARVAALAAVQLGAALLVLLCLGCGADPDAGPPEPCVPAEPEVGPDRLAVALGHPRYVHVVVEEPGVSVIATDPDVARLEGENIGTCAGACGQPARCSFVIVGVSPGKTTLVVSRDSDPEWSFTIQVEVVDLSWAGLVILPLPYAERVWDVPRGVEVGAGVLLVDQFVAWYPSTSAGGRYQDLGDVRLGMSRGDVLLPSGCYTSYFCREWGDFASASSWSAEDSLVFPFAYTGAPGDVRLFTDTGSSRWVRVNRREEVTRLDICASSAELSPSRRMDCDRSNACVFSCDQEEILFEVDDRGASRTRTLQLQPRTSSGEPVLSLTGLLSSPRYDLTLEVGGEARDPWGGDRHALRTVTHPPAFSRPGSTFPIRATLGSVETIVTGRVVEAQ